jgi:hypothetical protein
MRRRRKGDEREIRRRELWGNNGERRAGKKGGV